MTITVTNLIAGPFAPTGLAQTFPFQFMALSPDEVEVYQADAGVISPDLYTVTPNEDLAGNAIEGGSVAVLAGATLITGGGVYIRAAPSFEQEQQWSDTGSRMSNLNEALDRSALRDIALEGELGGKLDMPSGVGLIGVDADGNTYTASGGGEDTNLRADLGGVGGALLVGSSYGQSVERRLNYLDTLVVDAAMARPPFALSPSFSACAPSVNDRTAIANLQTGFRMVRQLRTSGFIDEYIYRNVTGTNFDGGWVLWSWRAFALNRVWPILVQPLSLDFATANELAFRLGKIGTDTYPDDYDNADINGLGMHGNMSKGSKDFRLDGSANLEPEANFTPGTILLGNVFSMTEDYTMKYRGVTASPGEDAASLNFLRQFNPDFGGQETGTFQALIPNLGFQDSPAPMMATNFGGPFDRAKIDNNPLVVDIIGSGGQKGNWRVDGPKSGTARFFSSSLPQVCPTVRAFRGPMIGQGAPNWTDLGPYEPNQHGLWHVTDQPDYTKLTGYMASSGEVAPKTVQPMPLGVDLQFVNTRGTEYFPDGPPA